MNCARLRFAFIAMAITSASALVSACDELRTPVAPLPIGATLLIEPALPTLFVADTLTQADTLRLFASARTFGGDTIPAAAIFRSLDPAVASVDPTGLVTAHSIGSARIVADAEDIATTVVLVSQAVKSVTLTLPDDTVIVGDSMIAVAQALDSALQLVPGVRYAFSSEDPSVATVDSTGLIIALTAGATQISVTAAGREAAAALTVLPDTGPILP